MKTWRCYALASVALVTLSAVMGLWLNLDVTVLRALAVVIGPVDTERYLHSATPSPVLLDRSGLPLYAFLNNEEQWRFPVAHPQIAPLLIQATLATEDKRFWDHAGVDAKAALRALFENLRHGRIRSGASTLTMQLVKLGGDSRFSGFPGKVFQALEALRLERCVDKKTLLSAYLNNAPYGGNIVGVEAAARRYFGKGAAELSLSEAALLAGLPKSPTVLHPLRNPEGAKLRRAHVLRRMHKEKWISTAMLKTALVAPLGVSWNEFPTLAPHTAMHLREFTQSRGSVGLTVDGPLQARLETLCRTYLSQFDHEITNVALMVVDTQSGATLARVGSADFHCSATSGQVDLCRAPRSPGSALKPFIYALALENQLLYSSEMLLDDTLDFGRYNPGNFDGTFNGLVSAADALRWSLNVPAVQTLNRVGIAPAMRLLERLGFDTIRRQPSEYGLGLVLGNCEVTLEALIEAYLVLARLGLHQPLRLCEDAPTPAPTRVFSEGVALAVWHMLEQPFPNEPWTTLVRGDGADARVCWKTGTSTGYHDAWAVAFNGQYVVGAWLGNNDGKPSSRLVGAQAALPLVSRVFRSLPPGNVSPWPIPTGHLREVKVCALTGLPIGDWCPVSLPAQLPVTQRLHRRCDAHRPEPEGAVRIHWPATTRDWDLSRIPRTTRMDKQGSESTTPSSAIQHRRALEIRAPVNDAVYVVDGTEHNRRLRLDAGHNDDILHWYHAERYLGASTATRPVWLELIPGRHQVSCMDGSGQVASVSFDVKM